MLIALSTIICIARMAQAEYVALDAESILHTVEFSTGTASVWSDYTGPIFRARRGLSEAIEQSLHDIGITQRGAVHRGRGSEDEPQGVGCVQVEVEGRGETPGPNTRSIGRPPHPVAPPGSGPNTRSIP